MVLTISLAARYKRANPALTQPVKAGTRFTYTPEGWKAELTWLPDNDRTGNRTHDR